MYRKPIRLASTEAAVPQKLEPRTPNSPKPVSRPAVYSVLWRKKSLKVHKTWEGDAEGTVVVNPVHGGSALVVKADGLNLGSVKLDSDGALLEEGKVLSSGRFEFEIGALLASKSASAPAQLPSARPVSSDSPGKTQLTCTLPSPLTARLDRPSGVYSPNETPPPGDDQANLGSLLRQKPPSSPLPVRTRHKRDLSTLDGVKSASGPLATDAPRKRSMLGMAPVVGTRSAPLQLNPFVPLRPSASQPRPSMPTGPLRDEDIDPALRSKLRPHQVEAVKFLHDAVIGKQHVYGQGAILADEMGLGKSLTAITLIDTLLRGRKIRHALVVCPVTLIGNWRAEFRKWLPEGSRLGVMVIDQKGMGNGSLRDPVRAFFGDRSFRVHQVMIVGYERTRLLSSKLVDEDKQFDLVVCDEGHKLKASGSKTTEAIASIVGDKRVLLTGTPIQNNLNEFWALADFVNPGCLGTEAQFTKRYVAPLDASPRQSSEALEELSDMCDEFMLRRDATVLAKYLSVPKTEYAIFCRPTPSQSRAYAALTAGASQLFEISSAASSFDQGACLQAITELKKAASGLAAQGGGKLAFLKQLLLAVRKTGDEKIVVVSGSTKVLDLCQELCAALRLQWLRLDGQTPQERRQGMVDKFNKQPPDVAFVFLLSSRSGGMGLNLVGGSRLVLVDCDWNPSIDAQAMARIHRDGQKRACRIYRLLATGTIDEKIFQRQLSKIGLSSNVLVESSGASKRRAPQFTREQLMDLFTYTQPETCNTLEALPEFESLKGYERAEATDDECLNAAVAEARNVSCILVKK